MAGKSIASMVVELSSNTEKFEAGMKTANETTKKQMSIAQQYATQEAKHESAREKIKGKIIAANAAVKKARKDNSESGVQKLKELEAALKSLEAQERDMIGKNGVALDKLKKQYKDVSKAVGGTGLDMSKLVGIAKQFLPALSVAAVVAGVGKISGELKQLATTAKQAGVSAGGLNELRKQADALGISVDNVDSAFVGFKKNIGAAVSDKAQAKEFERLGVSLYDVNGKLKTNQQLAIEVSESYRKTAGSARNLESATKLFGGAAKELLPILEQGGAAMEKAFEPSRIDAATAAVDRFTSRLSRGANKAGDWGKMLVGAFADAGNDWIDLFQGISLTERAALNAAEKEKAQIEEIKQAEKDAVQAHIDGFVKIKKIEEEVFAERVKFMRESETNEQKILRLQDLRAQNLRDMEGLDERSAKYIELYKEYSETALEIDKARAKVRATAEADTEKIEAADKRINDAQIKSLSTEEQIFEAKKNVEKVMQRLTKLGRDHVKYAEEYQKLADAEIKLADLQRQQATQAEAEKKQLEAQQKRVSEARAEFEVKLKIQMLEGKGNTLAAERAKAQERINELMKKYGYSREQAYKIAVAEYELEKKKGKGANPYSDAMQKKAQETLDKINSGKGGTLGKQSEAEAKAILAGEKVDFKTARFADIAKEVSAPRPTRPQASRASVDGLNLRKDAPVLEKEKGKDAKDGKDGVVKKLEEILSTIKEIPTQLQTILSA